MTAETVREEFGAPEAIETEPDSADSSWTYLHEEFEPIPLTVGPTPARVAVASIWGVPLSWAFAIMDLASDDLSGETWNHVYVSRKPIVLHFEGEKVVRWEVLPDIRESLGGGGEGYGPSQSFLWNQQQWWWMEQQRRGGGC